MKVLLTGAAGYLGSHLREALMHHSVTLSDVHAPTQPPRENENFKHCDITDADSVAALAAGHDAVVHAASIVRGRQGLPISTFLSVVVGGTWNLLDAAGRGGVKRFINVSSVAVAGWPHDSDAPADVDHAGVYSLEDLNYAVSKGLAEEAARIYGSAFGSMATVSLRPSMIAGDGANPDPVAGELSSHVHVDDVVGAIIHCLDREEPVRGRFIITAPTLVSRFDWKQTRAEIGFVGKHDWESK